MVRLLGMTILIGQLTTVYIYFFPSNYTRNSSILFKSDDTCNTYEFSERTSACFCLLQLFMFYSMISQTIMIYSGEIKFGKRLQKNRRFIRCDKRFKVYVKHIYFKYWWIMPICNRTNLLVYSIFVYVAKMKKFR